MKLFITLALILLSFNLDAGLAPRASHNEKHHAYANNIEICDIAGETQLIAYYPTGQVVTVISGIDTGLQWIMEDDMITALSDKVRWHGDRFTHRYKGAKILTYKKNGGKVYDQTITYDKN